MWRNINRRNKGNVRTLTVGQNSMMKFGRVLICTESFLHEKSMHKRLHFTIPDPIYWKLVVNRLRILNLRILTVYCNV